MANPASIDIIRQFFPRTDSLHFNENLWERDVEIRYKNSR